MNKPNDLKSMFSTIYYKDKEKRIFFDAMRDLSEKFGCFYLAYVVENLQDNVRVGFTSNPDWQDQYVGNNLINECHLWKTVTNQFVNSNQSFLILPWDTVKPVSSMEKDICLYREEMGLGGNGISFCSKNNHVREFFALAPEINDHNFVKHVLKNMHLIKSKLDIYRKSTRNAFNKS